MLRTLWNWIAGQRRSSGHRRGFGRGLRFGMEPLEERRLLSIVWANRGSDDFGTYYGANADTARSIVDKAFADWNRLIDLNWDNDHNPSTNPNGNLSVNVSAFQLTSGTRGQTTTTYSSGRPIRAAIQMDDNGGGTGWYFGLNDDHLFTSLATPFHGTIPGSGDDNDFYRTVTHELGHAVGVTTFAGAAISSYFINVGTDQVDPTQALKRFLNSGGPYGVQATLTTSGGGHFYEGPAIPRPANSWSVASRGAPTTASRWPAPLTTSRSWSTALTSTCPLPGSRRSPSREATATTRRTSI